MPGGVIRFVCILFLSALLFFFLSPVHGMAEPGKVLARVNGVNIYGWQITLAESLLFGSRNPHVHTESQTLKQEILKNVIDMEVLFQDAQKRGIEPDKRLVDGFVWNYKASFPSLAEYQSALRGMNATEREIAALAGRIVIMGACIEERYGALLTPTEAEAQKYYDENPSDFVLPRALRVRHILIKKDAAKGVDGKTAKARAQQVLARAKKGGEAFAAIAREASEGPEKDQGGDMGYVSEGALKNTELEPLEKIILKLQPGEIGNLVETDIGYHIVKALDERPESITPFETVKERLISALQKKKMVEALNQLASELKPGFDIEVLANP
ncbi:peptidylprolyl isomerase [Desulfatibacillum alkenivorans]|nr:peptidylprolyl isomerase [Desulfatibacillum alkenivorans]